MPKRKLKRPRDTNQLAKLVVDLATGEADESETELSAKRRAAGERGAQSRLKALTPEQRSEIARQAAMARWKKGD